MADDIKEQLRKRMKDGWIRTWMAFEVLAVTEEAADSSLKNHLEKMKKIPATLVYKSEFKKTEKVENPFKKPKHAYSKVLELEMAARSFDALVFIVLNYAPTSVEVLEPEKVSMDMGEAQGILNTMAETMHSFAATQRSRIMIDT